MANAVSSLGIHESWVIGNSKVPVSPLVVSVAAKRISWLVSRPALPHLGGAWYVSATQAFFAKRHKQTVLWLRGGLLKFVIVRAYFRDLGSGSQSPRSRVIRPQGMTQCIQDVLIFQSLEFGTMDALVDARETLEVVANPYEQETLALFAKWGARLEDD